MFAPAWASGARAPARIPAPFSTSFRQSAIFLTVSATVNPPCFPKNSCFLVTELYCGRPRAATHSVYTVRSIQSCGNAPKIGSAKDGYSSFYWGREKFWIKPLDLSHRREDLAHRGGREREPVCEFRSAF